MKVNYLILNKIYLNYEPEIKYIYRYDCDRICRMAYYSDDNDYDNDDDDDDDDEASNLSS